jgi:hypothetical protein
VKALPDPPLAEMLPPVADLEIIFRGGWVKERLGEREL